MTRDTYLPFEGKGNQSCLMASNQAESSAKYQDIHNGGRRHARPGDLIQFLRNGYEHWGVYVGNDRICQLEEHDGVTRIHEEAIGDVQANGEPIINNFKDGEYEISPQDTIVQRARGPYNEGRYSIWENNCEHFATWCRYGRGISGQVEAAIRMATFGLFGGR